jgi:SRSO17 transposase
VWGMGTLRQRDPVIDELLDRVGDDLGNEPQRASFARYTLGLLSDLERKSLEPIAAAACPEAAARAHKSLCYFVGAADWPDAAIRRTAVRFALDHLPAHDPVRGVVIDDTGLLKQGADSVGVQRQYTGSAGKITNCQVAVTLALFTTRQTIPLDIHLYLPETWATDATQRAAGKIPDDVAFQTKSMIALASLRAAHAAGLPLGDYALADADYGRATAFRDGVTALGLQYGVGVHATQRVWDGEGVWTEPMTVRALADLTPAADFRRTTWRSDVNGRPLSARFVVQRVYAAAGDAEPARGQRAEWLVIEWRRGEARPEHFYLCTFPAGWSRKRVIRLLKERWRIERLHEDLKGEVGFDHYEGRFWPGWQHHMTVVLCAYAALLAEQSAAFPPSAATTPRRREHRTAA